MYIINSGMVMVEWILNAPLYLESLKKRAFSIGPRKPHTPPFYQEFIFDYPDSANLFLTMSRNGTINYTTNKCIGIP